MKASAAHSADSAISARLMHARTAAAAQSSFDMLPPGAHERALPAGRNAGGLFYFDANTAQAITAEQAVPAA